MNTYQRGTFVRKGYDERVRLGALLVDLRRSLAMIAADIEIAEGRTQWPSPEDLRDPARSRALRARHDNLAATVRLLDDRVKALMVAPPAGHHG